MPRVPISSVSSKTGSQFTSSLVPNSFGHIAYEVVPWMIYNCTNPALFYFASPVLAVPDLLNIPKRGCRRMSEGKFVFHKEFVHLLSLASCQIILCGPSFKMHVAF